MNIKVTTKEFVENNVTVNSFVEKINTGVFNESEEDFMEELEETMNTLEYYFNGIVSRQRVVDRIISIYVDRKYDDKIKESKEKEKMYESKISLKESLSRLG